MRKYFDENGKPTTADKAVSSKGMQGGVGNAIRIGFAVLLLLLVIGLIAGH